MRKLLFHLFWATFLFHLPVPTIRKPLYGAFQEREGAYVQQYTLRFWLWRTHTFPWKMVAFLDDATTRILLRRVSGGYSFTHRLLLDYFADLDVDTPSSTAVPLTPPPSVSSTTSSQQSAAPASATAATSPTKVPKEEVLKKAYQDVQQGKIKDPKTIRGIAACFEAVARNPEASQTFSFDAGRAAQNLHKGADSYEELANTPADYDDVTQNDWMVPPRPNDENLRGGG